MGGKLGKDFDENIKPAPHRKRRNVEGKKKKRPEVGEDSRERARRRSNERQPWRWEDSDIDDALDIDGIENELEDDLEDDLDQDLGDDFGEGLDDDLETERDGHV
jgi:hypothetical protein